MWLDSFGEMIKDRSNYCAIVTDYDRTLTDNSLMLYEPLLDVLTSLRRYDNIKFLIASGRRLDFLLRGLGSYNIVNAIVAENGAVICLPETNSMYILGEQNASIREGLKNSSIPFDAGQVVISVKKEFEKDVIDLVNGIRLNVKIEYNRDSIMILPNNIDKALGVKEALRLLKLRPTELICIGDAENDSSLFDIGTVSVATFDAVPELKERADIVCSEEGAIGVTRFLNDLLNSVLKNNENDIAGGV